MGLHTFPNFSSFSSNYQGKLSIEYSILATLVYEYLFFEIYDTTKFKLTSLWLLVMFRFGKLRNVARRIVGIAISQDRYYEKIILGSYAATQYPFVSSTYSRAISQKVIAGRYLTTLRRCNQVFSWAIRARNGHWASR